MKKLLTIALMAAVALPLFAQEAEKAKTASAQDHRDLSSLWPAPVALCEYPESPDIIGFRFTIPYSTRQENVTGIDLGFWGRSVYFEGIQINILRNDVKDRDTGIQVGFYNSIGSGECMNVQAGLWNEAGSFRGVQAGLMNVVGSGEGVQVGLFNRAESFYGLQVGVINVIREAEIQFCPVANIGF